MAVTSEPSEIPRSRTASTVMEATSRTPPASSTTLAMASPWVMLVTRAGIWFRALSSCGEDRSFAQQGPRATPAPGSARRSAGAAARSGHAPGRAPRDRRRRRQGDLVHQRLAIDVLQPALQHQDAAVDDHALDVRGLRACEEELPDVDIAHGVRRAAELAGRARRRRRAGPARADRSPSRRRRPWRLRPRRARTARRGAGAGRADRRARAAGRGATRTSANMSSSSARPMSSSPSATLTPDATSRRSGATPGCEAQVRRAVVHDGRVPVRASRSMSASRSQTPWASALRSPSTPIAASRSSSRPPAKASPQARCSGLSSACRWMPAAELRRCRADRFDEPVARPLRRHDRELGAQQRVAGELPDEVPDRRRGRPPLACSRRRDRAPLPQLGRQRRDERRRRRRRPGASGRSSAARARRADPTRGGRAASRATRGRRRCSAVPSPAPEGKCMCRCAVTPDSISSTSLQSVPRYGSIASSASIVPIHDSNGVSRRPGSGGPGSG